MKTKKIKILISNWRKSAKYSMRMAHSHDKDGRACKIGSRMACDHEADRYRWYRVAQTFRYCASMLNRLTISGKE